MLLKITELSELTSKAFKTNNNEVVEVDSNRTDKIAIKLFKSKNSKNTKSKLLMCINIGATRKLIFLTLNTKVAFNRLKQAFIKVLIF